MGPLHKSSKKKRGGGGGGGGRGGREVGREKSYMIPNKGILLRVLG